MEVSTAVPQGRPRVLCVDDDPLVAGALARVLGADFEVVLADAAAAAIGRVVVGPPFAVVVSDYRMPDTDGVTLLGRVRDAAPDTVRILLTGNADLQVAVAAVNHGQIFRFLEKPCSPDVLRPAVAAASELYRLVTGERVLLEQTLQGSIKALVDVLALAQPQAFGRATRVRRHAAELAERVNENQRWPIEIAAMLSQVGCTALPSATIERFFAGAKLSDSDLEVIDGLPLTAERLIADIPRLDAVREILRFLDPRYSASVGTAGNVLTTRTAADRVPIGARILRIALDFDLLEMRGLAAADALKTMQSRTGWYDGRLLSAFGEMHGSSGAASTLQDMRLSQVRVGMVFAADVRSDNGMLLVARGQEVSVSLVDRIQHQWEAFAGKAVVSMMVQAAY
jgi:response regulator RpfG family c-di-GMP phosphodiesterase